MRSTSPYASLERDNSRPTDPGDGSAESRYRLFDCFCRRYSCDAADQLLTSFHADRAALTVNVALTSDEETVGGTLLGVYGGAVRPLRRGEGDATVHSSALLHGVTRMLEGTRCSLILFYAQE